jgi:methylmalonyl-CoA mutase
VLGGTQSLHTNALDEALALPTDFSARIARNTQLVLAEETGITKVIDPLGGSYYVESLTARLVEEAGKLIAEADALGGMTAAVASGMPKRLIEEAAAAKQARIDRGEDVIVGVNKYPLDVHSPIDTLEVDNHKVREGQVARIAKVRSARNEDACQAALAALTKAAKSNDNLLALAVAAARADATLGEISSSLEVVFGRYGTTPIPVRGVYCKGLRAGPEIRAGRGRRRGGRTRGSAAPRLLVAKMGQDGHDRGANVIASAFADMGFEVIPGPLFQTPRKPPRSRSSARSTRSAPARSPPGTRRWCPS